MALAACVKNIVCTLSVPVLVGLKTVVQGTLSTMQALQANLTLRSQKLSIQLIPVELARDSALAVLQEAESVTNLLPLSIIERCADLGSINRSMSAGVRQATAAVNDLADDATRLLSFKAEVDTRVAELDRQIENINDFIDTLDECIQEAL